jgi:hypothetical protein
MNLRPTFVQSVSLLHGIKVHCLFQEEPCVKGCAFFGRNPDSPLHNTANVLRVLFAIILAPLFVMLPHSATHKIDEFLKEIAWSIEFQDTLNALLFSAPAGDPGQYKVTNYKPQWMLRVQFQDDQQPEYWEVPWSPELHNNEYTAISYNMDSVFELFQEAGFQVYDDPPSPTR